MNIKPDLKKVSKQPGAKKGHKFYRRVIPARIDYIKELKLKKCPECGSPLNNIQEKRDRIVCDIKLITAAKTTKYIIPRSYCKKCKKIVEAEVPNALPHAKYGLNIMLLVMYLRIGLSLPINKIIAYFWDFYQIKIGKGEIISILKQLVRVFGDYYEHLEHILKIATVKHTDTTSWRISGRKYNAWVFVAYGAVLYKIRKRNNSKVATAFFGKTQKGMVLVIDRFSALRALAEKLGFLLQLCWSHILADSKDLKKNFGAEGAYVHRKLKEIYALAKGLNHKGTEEMVEQLKAEIFQLTLRHYKHSTVRKFVNNLYYRDAENLFRFVTNPEIDSTNNISERLLRAFVMLRKITNGSRHTSGAHTTAILFSVVQTLRMNNIELLDGLKKIAVNASGQ
ncbi:MAG: IS66 family transposase [Nanoarchaeota archaeon]|nr:IS66 family transposase [Nanoarchaeota archaeon]